MQIAMTVATINQEVRDPISGLNLESSIAGVVAEISVAVVIPVCEISGKNLLRTGSRFVIKPAIGGKMVVRIRVR